ncbi:hypothetical protein [Arthrobacter glacialis]|uniref:hypothetical protein n=1 Tax=Arthrobacter glacialis TaxID=1664 RepID=UPI001FAF1D84|nr:hypothetical protein [Arthrobacter glacialis]
MKSPLEHVEVRTSSAGVPVVVRRNGHEWVIGAEPVRWFERTQWWKYSLRMPKGQGRVDVQVWQVQARLGRNPRSDLVTMELERESGDGAWWVRQGVT